MRNIVHDEAFTGLEAAIVLIAFVVVAAVFSYVVLGAGFFTTQKSQEVVHSGVSQASSSMQIVGDVFGLSSDNTNVTTVRYSIQITAGGSSIDMSKVQMTWSTTSTVENINPVSNLSVDDTTPGTGAWSIGERKFGNTDNLLEPGEIMTIYVQPTNGIGSNTKFDLEIKPSIGASLSLTRTIPAGVNAVNKLY
ncbi:MAG: flagellin [Methanomicrobiales archaeon]|nr:flagellin [Methanomicrobiales archaeon]